VPPRQNPATGDALLPIERQQRILDTIRGDSATRVSALSRILGVSTMTIRRDLDSLERKGLLDRTHGGAVSRAGSVLEEFRYQASALRNPHLKRRIARRAATMVDPNDIVFLGEGATPALLVRYADPSLAFKVFSNNIGALLEAPGKTLEFVILGGSYRPESQALSGPITLEAIAQVRAAKTFLSADGFSVEDGLSTQNQEIASVERQMIRHTRGNVILMADHTKIGRVGRYVISPVSAVGILVTDAKTPPDFQKRLEAVGVRVVIA
jgi:DeoR family fructose operon transcriptional repressor